MTFLRWAWRRLTTIAWDVELTAPPGRRIVFGTRSEDTGRWVRR